MKKTDAFKETITQQLTDAVTGCSKRLKDNLCILNDKAVRNARFALNPTSVVISDNLTGKEFDVKEIYKRKTGRDDWETISVQECIDHNNVFPYDRVKNTLVEFISQIKQGKIAEFEKASSKGTTSNQARYILKIVN